MDCFIHINLMSPFRILGVSGVLFVLPAAASKTYIGSVLFRTLAYTGAKQASFWERLVVQTLTLGLAVHV